MFAANITRAEARARAAIVRPSTYEVLLDVSGHPSLPSSQHDKLFFSHTTVTFTGLGSGETHINLIADTVHKATLDGVELPAASFDGEHILFPVTPGDHVLTVDAAVRYSRTGEGLHRFVDPVDGRVYLYSQFESADARRAFAAFDQPDLKATFQFSVIAPSSWTVLSNSPAVTPSALDGGRSRWDFAPTPPISTYITAVCAGEFHVVTDTHEAAAATIPLSIAVRQSLRDHLDAERIFTVTKRGFDVFENAFGYPYPFADYAQIFVPEFNFGAMENAGCIVLRDEYIFRSRVTSASYESRDNTILHEMAHMWFGDLVTMRWWDDLWLNESFAEWAAHYAQAEIERRYGLDTNAWATFCNQRKTWAYRQDQLPSTHPIAADMVDLEAVELNFDGITYAKGASALRQLVAFVGEDAFLAGVRAYFAQHAWSNTEFDDLLAALTESSGRDLSGFASQWLQMPGVNTMTPDFEVDDAGRFTSFAVVQTADPRWPTLRSHRLAVGVYALRAGVLERIHRVEFDVFGPRTEVPALIGAERGDLVLLNDDDLTYAKIRFDDVSLRTLIAHAGGITSALTRALCWGATWDMCRDALVSASAYVALVQKALHSETDVTAVETFTRQAQHAIDTYAPAEQRAGLSAELGTELLALCDTSVPGSDLQLAVARAYVATLTSTAGADVALAWLSGRRVPSGLVVDADLRWWIIIQLARVGAVGEPEIAAEEAADQTATGSEKAAAARAARPDAASKTSAWSAALADDTPNQTCAEICGQFMQIDQTAVLAPYLDAYLDLASAIADGRDGWEKRSTTIRQHVLGRLFPWPFADRAYLDRVRAIDVRGNDFVRRIVSERIDEAERALRCQASGGTTS